MTTYRISDSSYAEVSILNSFLQNNWVSMWENLSSGVNYQVMLKPACSATETSYNNENLHESSVTTIPSK